jgi:hypothetical protein
VRIERRDGQYSAPAAVLAKAPAAEENTLAVFPQNPTAATLTAIGSDPAQREVPEVEGIGQGHTRGRTPNLRRNRHLPMLRKRADSIRASRYRNAYLTLHSWFCYPVSLVAGALAAQVAGDPLAP